MTHTRSDARQVLLEGPSQAPSPPGRITRKRAASINTEQANHPRIENLSLGTPSTASSAMSVESPRDPHTSDRICLCTPAPKVPRPRNAFILYRQHHQGHVVAQHPGLANPEISKIIGEQWRDESEEHKNQWKNLAEEEKQRHQLQYPDYRYQPRRGGKGGASTRPQFAAVDDPGRCAKCGGRFIATPRTPSTPFVTSTAGSARGAMPSYLHDSQRALANEMVQRQNAHYRTGMSTTMTGLGRSTYAPSTQHHQQISDEDYDMVSPSDPKRRRFDPATYYREGLSGQIVHGGHSYASHMPTAGQSFAQPQPVYRGHSELVTQHPSGPSASDLSASGPRPMGPPPTQRRSSMSSQHAASSYRPGVEMYENLRLPPLKTHLSTRAPEEIQTSGPPVALSSQPRPNQNAAGGNPQQQHSLPQNIRSSDSLGISNPHDTEPSSVESSIMMIPYVNKLKVLESISPPLPPPSASQPRGPVISVEGTNPAIVRRVGQVIEQAIAASGECAVRVWSSAPETGSTSSTAPRDDQLGEYLRSILDWHGRSAEIVAHVTRPAALARGSDASSSSSSSSSALTSLASTASSHGGGGGGGAAAPILSPQRRGSAAAPLLPPPPAPRGSGKRLPVALLAGGFSLSISDRAACAVPIADAYAPVDHWQWMATLWRGIVGPDLVVYARDYTAPAEAAAEAARLQAVEMKGSRVMVVRVREEGEGGVGEGTERRLGFEIVEWVRTGGFGFGM